MQSAGVFAFGGRNFSKCVFLNVFLRIFVDVFATDCVFLFQFLKICENFDDVDNLSDFLTGCRKLYAVVFQNVRKFCGFYGFSSRMDGEML